MAARHNHRVTMWKLSPSAKQSGRVSYSSAACPGGVNYCSNATAWANCCFDINGTYTIDVNAAYNYLQNAGFYGDLPFIFLGLMQRESSFTPDVIARCPPCCCTEEGVTAVGLLQVTIEAHPQYSVEWLKNPANNCAAAFQIYSDGGLVPWTPINNLDSPSSIAYWRSQVSQGTTPPTTEPGVSLAADIEAAPRPSPPPDISPLAGQPVVNPPPDMVRLTYPGPPAIYNDSTSGWESVTRYFTNDIPYYTGYDNYLVDILRQLPGSAG